MIKYKNYTLRLRNVLLAVCSGQELDNEAFNEYCKSTLDVILQNYSWYVLPPTVHKLLVHGPYIAAKLDLPIGQYSEEAQEAQNKELRNARLNHSSKVSRLSTMTNQFHYMLV